jgi:hypothetical protein
MEGKNKKDIYTEEVVLAAIADSGGVVSSVAAALKKVESSGGRCSWATAKKYIEMWESTKAAMVDAEEEYLDFAEVTLMDCMNSEDDRVRLRASEYVLSRKGKERGWGEDRKVVDIVNWSKMPDMQDWTMEDFKRMANFGNGHGVDEAEETGGGK